MKLFIFLFINTITYFTICYCSGIPLFDDIYLATLDSEPKIVKDIIKADKKFKPRFYKSKIDGNIKTSQIPPKEKIKINNNWFMTKFHERHGVFGFYIFNFFKNSLGFSFTVIIFPLICKLIFLFLLYHFINTYYTKYLNNVLLIFSLEPLMFYFNNPFITEALFPIFFILILLFLHKEKYLLASLISLLGLYSFIIFAWVLVFISIYALFKRYYKYFIYLSIGSIPLLINSINILSEYDNSLSSRNGIHSFWVDILGIVNPIQYFKYMNNPTQILDIHIPSLTIISLIFIALIILSKFKKIKIRYILASIIYFGFIYISLPKQVGYTSYFFDFVIIKCLFLSFLLYENNLKTYYLIWQLAVSIIFLDQFKVSNHLNLVTYHELEYKSKPYDNIIIINNYMDIASLTNISEKEIIQITPYYQGDLNKIKQLEGYIWFNKNYPYPWWKEFSLDEFKVIEEFNGWKLYELKSNNIDT